MISVRTPFHFTVQDSCEERLPNELCLQSFNQSNRYFEQRAYMVFGVRLETVHDLMSVKLWRKRCFLQFMVWDGTTTFSLDIYYGLYVLRLKLKCYKSSLWTYRPVEWVFSQRTVYPTWWSIVRIFVFGIYSPYPLVSSISISSDTLFITIM